MYDIGRIEGKPFIRMEYIDGYTIQDFIDKKGPVSFSRSKKPMTALLSGLAYSHKIGIIHRDLKPTNFMVTNDGKFKIIDFGISAFLENVNHTKLTKTGEKIVGEQFSDPMLSSNPSLRDIRSDIYSVGAIWYYLLVGCAPTGGDSRKNLVSTGNATDLQCEIIYKCLASRPDERYQSCDEILSILNPIPELTNQSKSLLLGNKITDITREYVIDYLLDRHNMKSEHVFGYYGRKDCITFLKRLYDLKSMSSQDARIRTFEEEIRRHTIANDDYEYDWVFRDERLGLQSGDDELFLKFICEMFHPVIRSEKSDWASVKNYINELLKHDGYEIFESDKVSGQSIFSYRYYV